MTDLELTSETFVEMVQEISSKEKYINVLINSEPEPLFLRDPTPSRY